MKARYFRAVLALALFLVTIVPVVSVASGSPDGLLPEDANTDNPSHPLGEKQAERHSRALNAKINGKVSDPVAEAAKGQFVELERQGEDSIWTVITVVGYKQQASVKLGPASTNTKQAQLLVVLLPDKQVEFPVSDPYSGDSLYFSGSGNNLDNSMSRSITLRAGAVSLSAKVSNTTSSSIGTTLSSPSTECRFRRIDPPTRVPSDRTLAMASPVIRLVGST